MARITVEDDNKVMDVAKPGKGKIMTTSRPVITPVISDAPKKDDVSATLPDTEAIKPLAPSATKKIIQPLLASEVETEESVEVTANNQAIAPPEVAERKPAEPVTGEPAEKTEEPDSHGGGTESSDAASVDAVADAVGSKKEAIKKAEDQAKRDAAVQELISSKKYIVPIGHEGTKSQRTGGHNSALWLVPMLVIIVALAAAILLIDAGVIETSLTLPFDLIK